MASVIGEEELSKTDKAYINFGKHFELHFLNQNDYENRSIEKTLNLGWSLLALLPKEELDRIDASLIDEFYGKIKTI